MGRPTTVDFLERIKEMLEFLAIPGGMQNLKKSGLKIREQVAKDSLKLANRALAAEYGEFDE